jgi:cytochrome c553
MGVATMARVCGECHEKTHGGPALPPPPDSADYYDADTLDERMGRHMWASELLWEGLTGPSDVSWKAGADRLIQAPAQLDDVLPVNFDGELRRVQAIGQSASEASTLTARADVYGLLIATCAQCHSRWLQHEDE